MRQWTERMRSFVGSPGSGERHSKLTDSSVNNEGALRPPAFIGHVEALEVGVHQRGQGGELHAAGAGGGGERREGVSTGRLDRSDRMMEACLRLVQAEWRRRHSRRYFDAWRDVHRLRDSLSAPEREIQRLKAELAYWRRSVDGARQVIDEQQRKIGEQALRIGALQKDLDVLRVGDHRAHAFFGVVEEQTRAISALQLQVAAMARLELSSGEEHSRALAGMAVRLADQARSLLLAMCERECRLDEHMLAHSEQQRALSAALADKARLEAEVAALLRPAEAPHANGAPARAAPHSGPAQTHQRSRSVGSLGAQLAKLSAEREGCVARGAVRSAWGSAGSSPQPSRTFAPSPHTPAVSESGGVTEHPDGDSEV